METSLPRAKTNHDTGLTFIIASLCMFVDHTGVVFFPGVTWMRIIGRITLPLFAWGIAIGAEHTRNMARYALRLFVLMIISQPFYMLALNHQLLDLNIFATLFLGLVGIWGLKERKGWMTAVALMVAHLCGPDYGIRGVFCILILWACVDNPLALAVCFCTYCAVWGVGYSTILRTEHLTITLQMCAALALPLMLWPRAKRTVLPKWLMYSVYPGHLLVLYLLKLALR